MNYTGPSLKISGQIRITFMFTMGCIFLCNQASAQVESYTTTEGLVWSKSTLHYTSAKPESIEVTELFPGTTEQEIEGFGGCFNELGWDALQMVSKEKQNDILNSLFNAAEGCAFTYCRMPLGANDYSNDWYSYNETKDDFGMNIFQLKEISNG